MTPRHKKKAKTYRVTLSASERGRAVRLAAMWGWRIKVVRRALEGGK